VVHLSRIRAVSVSACAHVTGPLGRVDTLVG
jgi:hypothetical protein